MNGRRIAWLAFVASALIACGDSQKPKPDVRTPDRAVTPDQSIGEGFVVDRPRADRPKAGEAGGDKGQPREAKPDQSQGGNDTCAKATTVTLVNGKATVSGTTVGLTNEFGTNIKCGFSSTTMSGPQAYYSLTLDGTKVYHFKVTAGFASAYFYLFTGTAKCQDTAINTDCGSSGATGTKASLTQSTPTDVSFKPPATGTYVFAIDSSSTSGSGTFSVDIAEQNVAGNGTCNNPQSIQVSGKLVINGDTSGIADEFSTLKCGGYSSLNGPQVYYSLKIAAGKSYKFTLKPTFSAYLYIFSQSGGCSAQAIETYCGSNGATGDLMGPVSAGATKTLVFTPTTADTFIIGVDSTSATSAGAFELDVEEFTPPQNGTCGQAQAVTLTGGKASIAGGTGGVKDEFATLKCGGYSTLSGPQVYYKLTMSVGKAYKLSLTPTFSAYLYVFSSAANCGEAGIESDCASSGKTGDVFGSSSSKQTYWFVPDTTSTYYLSVDSSSSSNQGDFTLDIEETSAPTNGKCSAATPITLTGGKASVSGTTVATKDEFATLQCGGYTTLDGPQVYYSFTAAAGKGYKLTLTPTFSAYLYAFSAAANCQEAAIETSCASAGVSGNLWGSSSSKATYYFAPTSPGTYLLGVDSSYSSNLGTFTLDIEEIALPTNTTCSGAQTVTLTSGSATIAAATPLGTNEFKTLNCGTGYTFDAPQLYYKVSLLSSRSYRLKLSPKFDSVMYLFPATANCTESAIETACASKGAAGAVLSVYSGDTGSIYFKPPADATFIVAVDGSWSSDSGDFTLTIDELAAPPNGTCSTAKVLTFASGVATVDGDTYAVADEFATLKCGLTVTGLAGPQLYYKIDLTQGIPYGITVTSAFYAYLVIFSSTAACGLTGIETDCASKGATGNVVEVNATKKVINFTPPTTGTYYIAVDSTGPSAGNFGWFQIQVKQPPPMPTFTAPFSWDFELTCQGLYATNDWVCGKLGAWTGVNCDSSETPPTAGHSGMGMWATGLNQCYSPLDNANDACNSLDPASGSVLGFKVTIPSSWTAAQLTYWDWNDYNGYADWSEVRINGTAVAATQLCTSAMPSPPVWTQRTVDLKSYIGKTIQVEFHFYATSVVQTAGWFIDDLSVTGS